MRSERLQWIARKHLREWIEALVIAVLATFALVSSGAALAEDGDYHLQVGDTIEVWIGQDPALNRKVTVRPDGRISMPLAGHLKVDGLSLEQAEAVLAEKLRPNFKDNVDVTAMLVGLTGQELTPTVFLVGDVAQPGQYSIQRGMTVLHAVSMAGGVYRPANLLVSPSSTSGDGTLIGLKRRLAVGLLRSARTSAELDDRATMDPVEEVSALKADALVVHAEQQEELMFEVRRSVRRRELETRDRQQSALRSEISALRAQAALNDTQMSLARKEQVSIEALMDKGLTPAARGMSMERSIAEIQAERAQIDSALEKAESSLEGSIAEATALEDERRLSLVAEKGRLDAELDELRRIVLDLESSSGQSGASGSLYKYSILRRNEDQTVEFAASELTPIRPGDLIRVKNMSPSQAIDPAPANAMEGTVAQPGVSGAIGTTSPVPSSN